MPNRIIDDKALLAWLGELAQTAQPCPTNAEINRHFAAGSDESGCAPAALKRLLATGDIAIERHGRGRQIVIAATGKATRPSLKSTVHAPRDSREQIVAAVIDLARQGKSEAFILKALKLRRHVVRYILGQAKETLAERDKAPKASAQSDGKSQRHGPWGRQIGFIGPSSTCRWIDLDWRSPEFWIRAFAGDETIYCGQRSMPGRSWCPDHLERVMVRRSRSFSPRPSNEVPTDPVERAFYRKCRSEGLNHMQALSRVRTAREGRAYG